MFRNSLRLPRPQALDLSTVRETVGYMHDDAARTPGYERLAVALGAVLREIDAAQHGRVAPAGDVVSSRFVPFRRARSAAGSSS